MKIRFRILILQYNNYFIFTIRKRLSLRHEESYYMSLAYQHLNIKIISG